MTMDWDKLHENHEEQSMNTDRKSNICPFVRQPFSYCYCFSLTSKDIDSAIYYCSNNYTVCDIYKKNYSLNDNVQREKRA
jgi:hypothetical protein